MYSFIIEIKVVRNVIFLTTLISMINLPGYIVLPPGVAKKFQIRKIERFDKSDRYFRLDHGVLIEIKVNFLLCTVLPTVLSKVDHTYKFDDFGQL